jgi:ubiquinone/menaquinone biosynthesis C-methylase UbiE
MTLMEIAPGGQIADVGAGSGWFTVRAARRVGPSGMVYAVDINPKYVRQIEERAKKERLPQVRAVVGEIADPRLPPGAIDAVLLLKTYHELGEPVAMAKAILRALKPCGRLAVIDRNGHGDDHGIDERIVIDELASVGFALASRHDFLRSEAERVEYLLLFKPAGCPSH